MVLNMGPILRGEITRMEIEYDLTPEAVMDVVFPENAHVKGYLTDDAGYMQLFLQHCRTAATAPVALTR